MAEIATSNLVNNPDAVRVARLDNSCLFSGVQSPRNQDEQDRGAKSKSLSKMGQCGYAAPRASVRTKLQESVFSANLANRQKYDELKRKFLGIEEDFYTAMRKQARQERERITEQEVKMKHDQERLEFVNDLNNRVAYGMKRNIIDEKKMEKFRTKMQKIKEEAELDEKIHTEKLDILTRLKELKNIESRDQLGHLDMLQLPEISSPQEKLWANANSSSFENLEDSIIRPGNEDSIN